MSRFLLPVIERCIPAMEAALRLTGREAFITLKSDTSTFTDNTPTPHQDENDFWSYGRTGKSECGSYEVWGLGLHAVVSPCTPWSLLGILQWLIYEFPKVAFVRLTGWDFVIERDDPRCGFFDLSYRGSAADSPAGGFEFYGFGLHVVASNIDRFERHYRLAREAYWAAVERGEVEDWMSLSDWMRANAQCGNT